MLLMIVQMLSFQSLNKYQQLIDLTEYNNQLEILIDRQKKWLELNKTLPLSSLTRSVMPLMFKMIDALDTFVELDVPFLIDERRRGLLD